MTIKLIALDLDDTLLDSKLAVSPRAQTAIRQAVERGVTVTVATGRMYRSALPIAQQLELDVPLITYNGALIKTTISGETLFHQPIESQLAQQVLGLCLKRDWYIQTYINDELFVREMDNNAAYYSRVSGVPAISLGDKLYTMSGSPTKMLVMAAKEDIFQVHQTFQEIFGQRLNVAISKPTFIEITDPAVNKGRALDFLAQKLGIKRDEVMALGDSGNDVDMVEYAGWGVAMGNASPAVKAVARLVTRGNDDDGVAEAIERYVLAKH